MKWRSELINKSGGTRVTQQSVLQDSAGWDNVFSVFQIFPTWTGLPLQLIRLPPIPIPHPNSI